MRSLRWALIQCDWCPYKKGGFFFFFLALRLIFPDLGCGVEFVEVIR